MAWPMHLNHRQRDEYRWERPPRMEDGQKAEVHAPRAVALLARRTGASERPDRPLDPTS